MSIPVFPFQISVVVVVVDGAAVAVVKLSTRWFALCDALPQEGSE